MKTNISKILLGVCFASAFSLTGCIDEIIPTQTATEEQVTASDKAAEALLWAMPASLNKLATVSEDQHYDWGYGSIMHIRDVWTGDLPVVSSGYNWYSNWEGNVAQGESYMYGQFIWNFYWHAVLAANKVVAAISEESASDAQKGMLGAAYAFRAAMYLDMAQMYEFLPNDVTTGAEVEGLTVPIVTEATTEEAARNNPRAPRDEMAAFILADLDKAEQMIPLLEVTDNVLPQLEVVYGLKARLYMWIADYANAKTYARKAIDETSTQPMTEDQCLSTTKGFNDISLWMWGSQLMSEDDLVKTGILNWTSWMSNETTFGYSSQEPFLMIDASLYGQISDTDFRKKLWKAPAGTTLDGETPFLSSSYEEKLCEYASVKFRPAEGNDQEPTVGAVSAYPLMRVEEMYFIEAEAAAHQSESEGRRLLTDFMTTYRDDAFVCNATGEDLINEIVLQKRVELWGEGLTFFDIKRLDMSVTRGYAGTNYRDAARFNTNGRPAWMNVCIVQTEKNNNAALIGKENPDPSGKYPLWVDPATAEE